jgi:hypothetical protein
MKKEYIFCFLTAPDCPQIIEAIFPVDESVKAFTFKEEYNGYITLRTAMWDYGKLPKYSETKQLS